MTPATIKARASSLRRDTVLIQIVARLASRLTRHTTGQGKTWTAHCVGSARMVNDIRAYRSAHKDGEWLTMSEAAANTGSSAALGVINDNTIKLFQQKYGTSVAGKKIEFVKRDTTGPNPDVVKRLAQASLTRPRTASRESQGPHEEGNTQGPKHRVPVANLLFAPRHRGASKAPKK